MYRIFGPCSKGIIFFDSGYWISPEGKVVKDVGTQINSAINILISIYGEENYMKNIRYNSRKHIQPEYYLSNKLGWVHIAPLEKSDHPSASINLDPYYIHSVDSSEQMFAVYLPDNFRMSFEQIELIQATTNYEYSVDYAHFDWVDKMSTNQDRVRPFKKKKYIDYYW